MHSSLQPALKASHRADAVSPEIFRDTALQIHRPDALEQFSTSVTVRRDAEIYGQGDSARFCYQVVSGCVRTVKLMEDGRRQVNDFLFAGDWFGVDALDEHEFSAEAVGEVVLKRYARRALDALAERDARVARWLLDLTAGQLRAAREHLVTLGRKTASERIAGFLLEMTRRMPADESGSTALPMSRTDIADHLGLTIETVCRCLAQFRRDGAIRLARTGFGVQSRPALCALANATRH